MLKAKSKTKLTKRKVQAFKEVMKDHNKKAVYAKISQRNHQKLRVELTVLEMTFDQWLTEKIDEIEV
jgi:hypothetical protein